MASEGTLIVNAEPLNRILEEIKLEPYSTNFLAPVDWRALGIETYPEIVKNPMDIGTLQVSNLNSDKISGNAPQKQNPNSRGVLAASRLDLAELHRLQSKRKRNLKPSRYSQKTRCTFGKKVESI